MKNRDEVEIYGYNCRLDTLQAIVGLWLFPQAEAITESRIATAKRFDAELSQIKQIRVPPRNSRMRHAYHLYMVHAEGRDALVQFLVEKGVDAKIHYPIPMHLQKASAYLGYKAGDFPVTEYVSARTLGLPFFSRMSSAQIKRVCDTLERILEKTLMERKGRF